MEKKISKMNSIKTKICFLVSFVIVMSCTLIIGVYSTNAKKQIKSMAQNYLEDLAIAYGEVVDNSIEDLGGDKALDSQNLDSLLSDVGLSGIESSYVYIVSPEGTMLYHPTPEKIGSLVENEVVKGVVSTIQEGKQPTNGVVGYEFKGAVKYAAVYVNDSCDYILVVTTDEDELLEPIAKLNKKGIGSLVGAILL